MISTTPDASSSTSTTLRNVASLRRPNSFRPSQVPASSGRQSDQEQLDRVRGDRALGADPQRAHHKGRDRHRLKHRALHLLGPAAQAAPDGDEDSGKPGNAAEHAVEEADAGIGRGAAGLDRSERGTKQRIEAVENQKRADADPRMGGVGPGQDGDADGNAERRTRLRTARAFSSPAQPRSFQTE